jgi:S-adenosyl methyltransferase
MGTSLRTGSASTRARVVYVDYDPVVLLHARTLLTSDVSGAIDYIDADLRDPGTIVREAARTLDFSRPVALTRAGTAGSPTRSSGAGTACLLRPTAAVIGG